MSLVIDRRDALKGQPGLHAFIVGISAYPHLPDEDQPDPPAAFGLRQLSSAALTALKMTRWLSDRRDHLAAPLATCRLLIAARPDEGAGEAELKGKAGIAAYADFSAAAKEWRADACTNRDNVTLFYFAGHGVKRERGDHVLILQNFGDGVGGALSAKAVNIVELLDGMAPSRKQKEIARTQLYVFDACRTTPEAFEEHQIMNVGAIWDVDREKSDDVDDRIRTLLFSAIPGAGAYGDKDGTLFGTALLSSLNGGAGVVLNDEEGDGQWGISLHALPKALAYHLDRINRTVGADQNWEISNLCRELIIQRLDSPPPVDVRLRVIPPEDAGSASVSLRDENHQFIRENIKLEPHPFGDTIPAGRYLLEASAQPPAAPARVARGLDASPPFTDCPIKFKPSTGIKPSTGG
jgi:hypothetical protein